jgi:hypothetical protein
MPESVKKAEAKGRKGSEKELRTDIGVRNPYALANAKLKQKIGWKKWTCNQRDDLFNMAFGRSFQELFDTDQRSLSPVYACQAASSCPAVTWAAVPSWFFLDKYQAGDPVQGAACDCYFIAALSSVAWTCQTGVIKKDETTSPSYYTVKFYDDKAGVVATIGVSKDLPVINNNLVYADSSTANEAWPAYYEKAYAQFSANLGSNTAATQLVATLPQQTMNALCSGGNPLLSLFHITKPWGFTTKTAKFPATDYADAGAMWNAINALTSGNKTKYPTVAWTYRDRDHAAQTLRMATADWLLKWADYASDRIIAQHSYSVLGTYKDATTGRQYIILRNTFGSDHVDPAVPNLYTGLWSCTNRFYKPAGVLNPAILPDSPTTDLSYRDGIFALEADAFRAYFEAFGWVG